MIMGTTLIYAVLVALANLTVTSLRLPRSADQGGRLNAMTATDRNHRAAKSCVIPTTIHAAAALALERCLAPPAAQQGSGRRRGGDHPVRAGGHLCAGHRAAQSAANLRGQGFLPPAWVAGRADRQGGRAGLPAWHR